MSEFTIRENDLSEASGISKFILKKTRGELLSRDEDYGMKKNAIVLTSEAALKVLVALEVSSPANLLEHLLGEEQDGKNEKNAPSPIHEWKFQRLLSYTPKKNEKSAGGPTIAEVVKLPYNTRIVDAVLESTERIRVRVRDSQMFVKGQRIPVEKTTSAVWKLAAKNPRRKGRIPGFEELREKTPAGV